jgi:hypothetical protein
MPHVHIVCVVFLVFDGFVIIPIWRFGNSAQYKTSTCLTGNIDCSFKARLAFVLDERQCERLCLRRNIVGRHWVQTLAIRVGCQAKVE